jgi:fumarate reductase subunit D
MDQPARQEDGGTPERHLLDNPFVWLLFQGAEFAILVFIVLPFLESVLPHGWPEGVYIASDWHC